MAPGANSPLRATGMSLTPMNRAAAFCSLYCAPRRTRPWRSPLEHPQPQQDRAVTEVGPDLNVRAGIRSSDQHIRAAQNFAHRIYVAAVIRIPEGRAEIFFKR